MSVTLKDIAAVAGVRPAVVSVVLNDKHYIRVSSQRREYIRRLAAEMGYHPNLQASSLRTRKKATVGVFLPPWRDVLLLELSKGLVDEACKRELPLDFYFGMTSSSYAKFVDSMTSCRNTGIISYVPFWLDDYGKILGKLETYLGNGGKIISLNTLNWPMKLSVSIDIDDACGGRQAADFLLQYPLSSHVIISKEGDLTNVLREKAFCGSLEAQGKEATVFYVTEKDIVSGSGVSSIEGFLRRQVRPVGIMAVCTEFTMWIQVACMSMGWRLGVDYRLVGYDFPMRWGDLQKIPRVIQPFYEMGALAIVKLQQLLLNQDAQSEVLCPKLVQEVEHA